MSCSCCLKCINFIIGMIFVVLILLSIIFSFKYTKYDFENNKVISETFRDKGLPAITFEGLLSLQNHSNRSTLTIEIFSYILFACAGIALIIIAVFCIIGKIKKKDVYDTGSKFVIPFVLIGFLALFAQVITHAIVLFITFQIRSYSNIKGHDELIQGYLEILDCTYKNFYYSIFVSSGIPNLILFAIIKSCIQDEK